MKKRLLMLVPFCRFCLPWLPLLVAAGVQVLVVLSIPPIPMNDTIWYLSQTFGFPGTRPADFYALVQPPPTWEVTYPPGLPWLWDALLVLFGRGWAVGFIALQHALRLGVVECLRRMDGPGRPFHLGWWVALAYALHLPSAIYCQALLSEPLFTFLLVLGLYAWGFRHGRASVWVGGCALALGAVLVRFVPVAPMALAALCAWQAIPFSAIRGASAGRPSLQAIGTAMMRAALPLAAPTLAAMALLVMWNGTVFGRWSFGTHVGRHVFDRAFCMGDFTAPDHPDYARLLALGRPVGTDAQGNVVTTLHGVYWYEMFPVLRQTGLSLDEADALMGRAGWAALRRRPLGFAGTILTDLFGASGGRVMSPDGFIPEWLIQVGERPPPERDPWLVPGATAGAPAEVAARRRFVDTTRLPRQAVLPSAARRRALAWLDTLPRWHGAMLWLVLIASLSAFRWLPSRAHTHAIAAQGQAVVFWVALVFPVAVHGPLPRYYTALVPLALWLSGDLLCRFASRHRPLQR